MSDSRPLDEKLKELSDLQAEMFDRVGEQFSEAVWALLERDVERAARVRSSDDEVDILEIQIDDLCERILALHSPVAVDLRMLLTAVKVNTDLERIGDHCKNLAKGTPPLADWEGLHRKTRLMELADTVQEILNGAREAFLNRNADQAREVMAIDERANLLYHDTFETATKLCEEHPERAETIGHLLAINKALERIGDHAKNIAESVVFLQEGVDIRHGDLQASESRERDL